MKMTLLLHSTQRLAKLGQTMKMVKRKLKEQGLPESATLSEQHGTQ